MADDSAEIPKEFQEAADFAQKELNLDPSLVVDCVDAFQRYDLDGSGFIDAQELRQVLSDLGEELTDGDYSTLLRNFDCDRSGALDIKEFLEAIAEVPSRKLGTLTHKIHGKGRESRAMEKGLTGIEKGATVPESFVKNHLRKEISEASACLQLPMAIILFSAYTMSIVWHEQIYKLHIQDRSIEYDIIENANFAFSGDLPFENGRMGHKSVHDVNTIADFWSWLSLGLVPILFVEGWDISETRANIMAKCVGQLEAMKGFGGWPDFQSNSTKDAYFTSCPEPGVDSDELLKKFYGEETPTGMYLYYNRLIGGLRMRQEIARLQDCGNPDIIDSSYGTGCFDNDYWLEPERRKGLHTDSSLVSDLSIQFLKTLTPQSEIKDKIRELEDKAWLFPGVQKVELTFITYNGNMDGVTMTFINFFFTSTGHIHKQIEPVTIWLNPYHGFHTYIADVIWVAILANIFVSETIDVISYIRQLGCGRGIRAYFSPWNAVDWCSCIFGLIIVGMWFAFLGMIGELKDVLASAKLTTPGSWNTLDQTKAFFDKVEAAILYKSEMKTLLAFFPFIIVSRFFKAFDAQPRLSVVTRTLATAYSDVYHFGIVFLTMFLTYTISGMLIFGQELKAFAQFGRAVNSCWRLLCGDFDWDDLTSVGRLEASLWFWTFTIMVQTIMLNMLLAIILDVYTEVKGKIGSADTLVQQSMEIWIRWKAQRAGRMMSLESVLKALDPTDLEADDDENAVDEMLSLKTFLNRVPGLTHDQAADILTAASASMEHEDRGDVSLSDAMIRIHEIDKRQVIMFSCVDQIMYMTELITELQPKVGKFLESIGIEMPHSTFYHGTSKKGEGPQECVLPPANTFSSAIAHNNVSAAATAPAYENGHAMPAIRVSMQGSNAMPAEFGNLTAPGAFRAEVTTEGSLAMSQTAPVVGRPLNLASVHLEVESRSANLEHRLQGLETSFDRLQKDLDIKISQMEEVAYKVGAAVEKLPTAIRSAPSGGEWVPQRRSAPKSQRTQRDGSPPIPAAFCAAPDVAS